MGVTEFRIVKRAKMLDLTLREIKNLVSVADGCSTTDIAHHLETAAEVEMETKKTPETSSCECRAECA